MTNLKFTTPPASLSGIRGRIDHAGIAAELKNNPGKWAEVPLPSGTKAEGVRAFAFNIRRAKLKQYRPAGDFEAVSRIDGDTVKVWARYVGKRARKRS